MGDISIIARGGCVYNNPLSIMHPVDNARQDNALLNIIHRCCGKL
jgi:hypothetical protein